MSNNLENDAKKVYNKISHYFYVFYKGENNRVAPILRLDYAYLKQHIKQVRKITQELGYDRNGFINGTQGVRSEFVKIQSEGANSRTNVNAADNSGSNRRPDRLLSVERGGSGEGVSAGPQLRELAHSGVSDEQHKGERNRNSERRGIVGLSLNDTKRKELEENARNSEKHPQKKLADFISERNEQRNPNEGRRQSLDYSPVKYRGENRYLLQLGREQDGKRGFQSDISGSNEYDGNDRKVKSINKSESPSFNVNKERTKQIE